MSDDTQINDAPTYELPEDIPAWSEGAEGYVLIHNQATQPGQEEIYHQFLIQRHDEFGRALAEVGGYAQDPDLALETAIRNARDYIRALEHPGAE